jgi:hypothetical protein
MNRCINKADEKFNGTSNGANFIVLFISKYTVILELDENFCNFGFMIIKQVFYNKKI